MFFVNGEKQDIVYPARIWVSGFKGYGPSFYMLLLKVTVGAILYNLIGFQPIPGALVIGRCADIRVSDSR